MNSAGQSNHLEKICQTIHPLQRVLHTHQATLIVIRDDGVWRIEEHGVLHLQPIPLPTSIAPLFDLLRHQGPQPLFDDWWLCLLPGGIRSSLSIQRRPHPSRDALSSQTMELLRTRLPRNTNGLLFSDLPATRSGLLLNLIHVLPPDFIIYFGAVPPVEPENHSLLHLPLPNTNADRQKLSHLLHHASAVLFDGTPSLDDLHWLLTTGKPQNRWIALQSSNLDEFLSHPVLSGKLERFQTHLGLQGGRVTPARLSYLSIFDSNDRQILLNTHTPNTDPLIPPPDKSLHLSAQITFPSHHNDPVPQRLTQLSAGYPEAIEPFDLNLLDSSEPSDDFRVSDRFHNDSSAVHHDDRHLSGKINVPGFGSHTDQELGRDSSSVDYPADDIADAPTSMLRGERFDAVLPHLLADIGLDEIEFSNPDPEQQRQTIDTRREQHHLSELPPPRHESNSEASFSDQAAPEQDSRQTVSRRIISSRHSSTPQRGSSLSSSHKGKGPATGSHRVLPIPHSTSHSEQAHSTSPIPPAPRLTSPPPVSPGLNPPSDATEELEIDSLLLDLNLHNKFDS